MAEQSAFAREICEKLAGQAGTEMAPVSVRGETPIRPYYTPRDRHGNPINILKVKPKTDPDKCGGCGLCAELCPMGSIDPVDVSQVRGICIKCCACVKKCPSGAKYFDDPGYLFHQHELEDVYTRRAENRVVCVIGSGSPLLSLSGSRGLHMMLPLFGQSDSLRPGKSMLPWEKTKGGSTDGAAKDFPL